jgi:hypothetical protein
MAQAADEYITRSPASTRSARKRSGMNTSLLTQVIADLEVRLTEPAAG